MTKTIFHCFLRHGVDYGNSVLAGLPVYLVRRLQSVLNAAARLAYHLCRSDHNWCACLPPLAARAGASPVQDRRSDLHQRLARTSAAIPRSTQLRRRLSWPPIPLRFTATNRLTGLPVKLKTVATWNDPPDDVTSAATLSIFRRQRLKT